MKRLLEESWKIELGQVLTAQGRLFSALMILMNSLESKNDAISPLGHCQESNILVGVVALDILS